MEFNAQASPPKTCAVELQLPVTVLNKGTMLQGQVNYTNQFGVKYVRPGMTVSDFNRGLRVPQQRTFLGPEYFNGGCAPLYCKDGVQCPQSVVASTPARTNALFEAAFGTLCPLTGNDAPPECFLGKCSGYNSTIGWEVVPSSSVSLNGKKNNSPGNGSAALRWQL